MPISYEPKILIAYFAIATVGAFGWTVGGWIGRKITAAIDKLLS